MAGGRPTDYDPAYCDDVVEWGKLGKSRAWIAAELNISRQTLANWEAAHPEFLDATGRAGLYAQRWWEDAGQDGMEKPVFNASVWSKSMAARFPQDWRDKTLVGSDPENPLPAAISLAGLSPATLRELAGVRLPDEV